MIVVLVLTHNFEMRKPVEAWLLVFAICGLWLQRWQWQNCKSKQAIRFNSKPILLRWWSFDSKPILLWLQLYFDATGNFVLCLQLSKLKLGLELKQKFAPKPLFLNNSPHPANVKKYILSLLWNLRGWRSSVASVRGSCFNSQFWGLETSNNLVVSVYNLWVVVSERAVAKL